MELKMIWLVMILLAIPCTVQSGKCDLLKFWGGHFQGKGFIHPGFKGAILKINYYAWMCSVKVDLTSSFRKDNKKKLQGAIVKPSTRSNHFVGHAIDMNLFEGGSRCNNNCLLDEKNHTKGVKCFINQIRQDKGLRWGGDFSKKDAVHIDDAINLKKSAEYDRLYQSLQINCKHLKVSG